MAKISLVEEVLKHSDDEIMDFLAERARVVRIGYNSALDNVDPNILFSVCSDMEIISSVIIALDRRNKNRNV